MLDNPDLVDGALQRGVADMRSARRGAYRILYEIDEARQLVIVLRVDHRSTVYRPR
jgi:mRNA-degrading endonuclease RelE of RelBE toxin-antitoxin system